MRERASLWKVMGLALCLIMVIGHGGVVQASELKFSDVSESHWAWQNGTVVWGVEHHIAQGYPDGTFQPDRHVMEAEFLAMLLRAFPSIELPSVVDGEPWYAAYYALAEQYDWPVLHDTDGSVFNRGFVAVLLAATQGERLSYTDAIQYVLDHELARGKTTTTIDGYFPEDKLTRAEALSLIKNITDRQLNLHSLVRDEQEESDDEQWPISDEFEVRGVMIGKGLDDVIAQLGEPDRKDPSMYGFTWYVYNADYANYVQIGIDNDRVVALYSNVDNWASKQGIKLGSSHKAFEAVYGKRVEVILKGNVNYLQSDWIYFIDGNYVTVFVDEHDDERLAGILIVSEAAELGLEGFYAEPSEALELAFEQQLFDLVNATRSRYGLAAFDWDAAVAVTAKKHSVEMADSGYVGHTNLAGLGPGERMIADGILYRYAAENVAGGHANAMFVHDGLMNSLGHRENILSEKTTRLGVGVAFGEKPYVLYYTQKFYTPR